MLQIILPAMTRLSSSVALNNDLVSREFGNPRALFQVVLRSGLTGLLYYGWYKWIIHEELRRYNGAGWSGTLCLAPFLLGVAIPQLLRIFDPDVPGWFGWFSLLGVLWIYIVQYRLYRTVNALFLEEGQPKPLVVWWLVVPGLNLWIGLQQIHCLSQFWAVKRGMKLDDPLGDRLFGKLF